MNHPSKTKYLVIGIILYILYLIFNLIPDVINSLVYNTISWGLSWKYYLRPNMLPIIPFIISLLITTYYAHKYLFQTIKNKKPVYSLPLINFLLVVFIASIVELVMYSTCSGENCIGVYLYPFIVLAYLIPTTILACILGYFIYRSSYNAILKTRFIQTLKIIKIIAIILVVLMFIYRMDSIDWGNLIGHYFRS